MDIVKIGTSRQIVIPKKLHDKLGLAPGNYLQVELRGHQLILTPKEFIDKRLAEGLKDIATGKVLGPFDTAGEALQALKGKSL